MPERSKVMPLSEAVRRFVRPGAALHLAYGGGRPNAAVAEIVRQYAGSRPDFRISAHGFVNSQHALIGAGLVSHLVTAFAGENYPAPRPNPVLQRAVRRGALRVENWSLWTLTARLMAGALGVPHFPVRSLAGSGIAEEHLGRDYAVVDAFGSGEPTGVVSPLRPDLVLVQALAADPEGNVVLPAPYGEGAWGALAARTGVIACVENVLDSATIRRVNTLPMIPARVVRAVCHTPFGAHPYGLYAGGLDTVEGCQVEGYTEDAQAMRQVRRASTDDQSFQEWMNEWVLGPVDHADYLRRLGPDRLSGLRPGNRQPPGARAPVRGGPSVEERMVLTAARVLVDRIEAAGHSMVLAGIGFAHLAAWTAVERLRANGADTVQLLAEIGMVGFHPQPGDPYLFANQNLPTCSQLTDVPSVLGRDIPGPAGSCIGVLGAGQIDAAGNLNSTWTTDGDFLLGSGGANDTASAADEVVVVLKHSAARLVDRVGYVTAPGHRVTTVVTSEAIFEREAGEFVLTGYLAEPGADREAVLDRIRATTGWPVKVGVDPRPEPWPEDDDLTALRRYDPESVFLGRREGTPR